MRLILLLLILPFLGLSQNCSICPPGTSVQLTSPYPSTAAHLWTCTNGFVSTQQNPTFAPIADVTCSLTASESGCTSTTQSIVDVCDCTCNQNACISMNYNSTTECVTFANTGTYCSPLVTEARLWRNLTSNPWVSIPGTNQVCDCDIRERVNTTAAVTVNAGSFRLTINGLQNRCAACTGNNMQIDFMFGVAGFSSTAYPGCAGTSDWYTITPANFAAAGYVAHAYVKYTTPYGVVVNYYRFTYNGGGLAVGNVAVQQVYRKSIYKTIYTQRTLTFSDGCPTVTCNNSLTIPQQPNDPCTHFVSYINTVNIGAPCNGAGLSALTVNPTGTVTYQWKYNGTNIAGQTGQYLCMVGRPNGTYCCVVSDGTCTDEICIIVQPICALAVTVTSSGNTLTATTTNCVGTKTHQWQRWDGTTWINVGTNSATYNTGGLAGEYRVNVSCSGPPACSAIGYITFSPPCTADVTLSTTSTSITATVTGCSGASIVYVWQRWDGSSWITVQTTTTTSTTNTYTPTLSGLYRITITCGNCSDQNQVTFSMPNPCTGFSADISGTFSNLCVGTPYTFNRTITGGTAPFTQVWSVNGLTVGTGTSLVYSPTVAGTITISITVTDANNCTYTDSQAATVIVCCGITLSISPTSNTVCLNENAPFTVTATGGTAPYSYSWTYSVPGGPVIGAGTGNPKTFSFSTANTYTIVCTVTDAVGCQFAIYATLTVTACSNCACSPGLTLNGCVLTGSFTGSGCNDFTYQLQYSATGTGWSVVNSGIATIGGTFNYTPTANGFYRLVINAAGCGTFTTPDISVTCFNPTCTNPPTLVLNGTGQTVCGLNPVTVSGNTFGGSATNVTITENGSGTITPATSSTSPFSFTYTPTSSDYLQTITVTVTTNNPLGSPCVPQTRTYGLTINPIPTPTITSSNANMCVGTTRTITTNPTGGTLSVTGPGSLVGNTLTATGVGTIILNYSVTSLGCTGSTTQSIVSESCPCNGFSMTMSTLPGRITFGTLNYNGNPLTNYRIQWRKCSDNSVVFESGMGTGAGAGIYSHPYSNLPVPDGCYYAFIVTSDQGNNLDCFPDLNVVNWTCGDPPNYTYSGPGGSAATREFEMDITASTTHIKVGNYQVAVVPDLLEIIYNGVTVYSGSTSTTNINKIYAPITYVSGVNSVLFRVTNSTPSQNTIWTLNQVSCCTGLQPCLTIADIPQVASVTPSETNCSCVLTAPLTASPSVTCRNCGSTQSSATLTVGGCTPTNVSANTTCLGNGLIAMTKGAGANRFLDFANSTMYTTIKALIQSATGDQVVQLIFKSDICTNDGTLGYLTFWPTYATIVYDDVNFTIDITQSQTNPFPDNCSSACNKTKRSNYANHLTSLNGTDFVGNYQSITSRIIVAYTPTTVNTTYNKTITWTCTTYPCTITLERKYQWFLRNTNCPCQSWQLFEDTDLNGTYETLRFEQAGWTGTCL